MHRYLRSLFIKPRKTKRRRLGIEQLEERTMFAADGFSAIGSPDALFAPGTSEAVVDAYEHAGAPGDPFRTVDRWNGTATDGFGLGQGDPTTVTWSIVRDGVSIDGFIGEDVADSDLVSFLGGIYGVNTDDDNFQDEPWFDELQSAFDRWEELSGINYVYEPNDDGAPFAYVSGSLGERGDVRLGGHRIDGDSNVLAYNFFPDTGDMVIDTDDNFYNSTFLDSRALRNVVAHELGHGLGFSHATSDDANFLLEPFISFAFDGPQYDDILVAQRQYGDALEKAGNDSAGSATDLGDLNEGSSLIIGADAFDAFVDYNDTDFVSIDDDSDVDFFRFSVDAGTVVDIELTPLGPTYDLNESQFDASALNDLTLTLLDSSGSTVLATVDAGTLGDGESINDFLLQDEGDYLIRIGALHDNIQMYQLALTAESGDTSGPGAVELGIAALDADKAEGDGNTMFTFQVTRSGDLNQATTVDYNVAPSGTSPLNDGEIASATSGSVQFAAGEASQIVTVTVAGDTIDEPDETFSVTLSNPSAEATIVNAVAEGIVRDDDEPTASGEVQLVDGVLLVQGTSQKDTISISLSGKNGYTVKASFLPASMTFATSSVESILVQAGDGDDRVTLSHQIKNIVLTVEGEGGNDTIQGGRNAVNRINGGEGNDKLTGGNKADEIRGGSGADNLDGRTGDDSLFGEAGNDRLKGGSGGDELFGGDGNDKLIGGNGADWLFGGAGNDNLNGGRGTDIADGGAGNDRLVGDGGDILLGGAGVDSLRTTKGRNILVGGSGRDKLEGARSSQNVMVGGSADLDHDTLVAALNEWLSDDSYEDRVDNLLENFFGDGHVTDDQEVDTLTYKSSVTLPVAGENDTEKTR